MSFINLILKVLNGLETDRLGGFDPQLSHVEAAARSCDG